jgi:hypothetical protein
VKDAKESFAKLVTAAKAKKGDQDNIVALLKAAGAKK